MCLIDDAATVKERITYDAYGKANHRWRVDLDGDGQVNQQDLNALYDLSRVNTQITASTYEPDADLDRDGDIDVNDYDAGWAEGSHSKLANGSLSQPGIDNVIGFSGYVYNDAPTGWSANGSSVGVYTVRFRHYDTGAMRWLTRDPAGYVDGANLYGYGPQNPIGGADPYGLDWLGNPWGGDGYWHNWKAGWNWLWGDSESATRVRGLGKAALGFAIGVAGFGIGFTPAGILMIAYGLDLGASGLMQAIEGEQQPTILTYYLGEDVAMVVDLMLGGWGLWKAWRYFRGAGNSLRMQHVAIDDTTGTIIRQGCFVAGTLVLCATATMPIEDVQAGDEVWSYDQEKQEWVLAEVLETEERWHVGEIVTITIALDDGSTETIEATGNHPFWLTGGEDLADRPAASELTPAERAMTPQAHGGRWTEARWLRLGDHFLTRTGKSATVAGLTVRIERVMVYNLHVGDLQLYAVGGDGVLVHNSDPARGLRRQLERHRKKLEDYIRDPDAHDNLGFLRDNPELRDQIVKGRIRNLERQIKNFEEQIRECERRNPG